MNINVQIATKKDHYIVICIENVTTFKSEYDIVNDINVFTIANEDIMIKGNENKIERIEKWGGEKGSFKELHCNIKHESPFKD